MAIQEALNNAIQKSEALAVLRYQVMLATQIQAMSTIAISEGKLDVAAGLLQALSQITKTD